MADVVESQSMDPFAFADDLNAMFAVPQQTSSEDVFSKLRVCQASLHHWGRSLRVKFDASKEKFCILSRSCPVGSDFKLLGVVFDCKLVMSNAVESAASRASAKLRALLRAKRFFNLHELVLQYKSHVLSLLEYPTPAIYHASSTLLSRTDRVQP